MRRRTSLRGLTNSRIYPKRQRFYYFSEEPIENPNTGKVTRWHSLCSISEGEEVARQEKQKILLHNKLDTKGQGDLPIHFETYRLAVLKKREKDRPKEPARVKLFEASNKEISRVCNNIANAFADFNADQVLPVDVAKFLDQWEGKLRMAQTYKARLSDFFAWCCRKGLRSDNPCREVSVEKPAKRRRYITHEEFHAIRDALLIGVDGRPTQSGPMAQCYIDLLYLLYQRGTEVRLLKWSQIDGDVIHFIPTKTERSSGASVDVPVTKDVREVLERAKSLGRVKGMYVIHKPDGTPYTTRGIGSAWTRACERAGMEDATLKDLRAKAMTDAKKAGFTMKQLREAAAHTDEAMTEEYIKQRETPVSEVVLMIPERKKTA